MHTMKKSKAIGADEVRLVMLEMTGEVGVTWTGRLLNVCMQEGRIRKDMRMGLIVRYGRGKGMCMIQEMTGLKLLERVFRRNDHEKSR